MSNPNPERDERVRQIRDTLATMASMDRSEASITDGYAKVYVNHVGYLLSLLDSKATGTATSDFAWALRELAGNWVAHNSKYGPHGFNENARRVFTVIANQAATAMRGRCVEKVGEHLHTHPSEDMQSVCGHNGSLQKVITTLQSLTLDQVEQEKR